MKKTKIIFWISTGILFLWEGVMPALTGHSEMSIEGITRLGYPLYFVTILVVFKVFGSVAIITPVTPPRIKEWAYFGLLLDFVCASISLWAVDGFSTMVFFPLIFVGILAASYISYHKLNPAV
ncbi:MAG: DoxX family protein [Cyclobacteriaceae bacterium]|nr:DoxX family protein [Cyclobacteriaceae bacterium]